MFERAEQSVAEVLKTSALGARLRKVAGMEFFEREELAKQKAQQLAVETPSAYIAPIGAPVSGDTATVRIAVLFVGKNGGRVTGHVVRDGAVPLGINKLVDLGVSVLHGGQADGIAWQVVAVDFIDNQVFAAAGLAIASVLVEAPMELPQPVALDDLPPFETFVGLIDIPPHEGATEHGKWLAEPPDNSASSPDAQTHVSLEQ